jgi:hypothetical protein
VTSPDGLVALAGPGTSLVSPLKVDKPRPDVAAYFKNPTGKESGFAGSFFIPKLQKGTYFPRIYRRAGPGWIVCVGKQPVGMP